VKLGQNIKLGSSTYLPIC